MNYHQVADLLWAIGGILIIVGIIVFGYGIWEDDKPHGDKMRLPELAYYVGAGILFVGLIVGGISYLVQLG